MSGVEKDLSHACFLALSVTPAVTHHLEVAFVSSSSSSQFLFFLHTQRVGFIVRL